MTEQLKDCPFCGGEAKLDSEFNRVDSGQDYVSYFVECQKCDAKPFPVSANCRGNELPFPSDVKQANREAADIWNTRATPVVTEAMVEAGAEIIGAIDGKDWSRFKAHYRQLSEATLTAALGAPVQSEQLTDWSDWSDSMNRKQPDTAKLTADLEKAKEALQVALEHTHYVDIQELIEKTLAELEGGE